MEGNIILNMDIIQNVRKSQEAFLLAIEIYNKPTIKYRLEGFSFFICNSWEFVIKSIFNKRIWTT